MSSENIGRLWSVTVYVLFLLILSPGVPWWLLLIPLLVVYLFITFLYPTEGICFIAFTHSFAGLVRWKEPDAVLLAGFGTILVVVTLVGTIYRGLLTHMTHAFLKRSIGIPSKAMLLVWSLFTALILLNVIANWKGMLSA